MHHSNSASGNLLTDKVKVNLDVFGALMLHRVRREVDGIDVVTIDDRSPSWRSIKLMEKLPKPTSLIRLGRRCRQDRSRWREREWGPGRCHDQLR